MTNNSTRTHLGRHFLKLLFWNFCISLFSQFPPKKIKDIICKWEIKIELIRREPSELSKMTHNSKTYQEVHNNNFMSCIIWNDQSFHFCLFKEQKKIKAIIPKQEKNYKSENQRRPFQSRTWPMTRQEPSKRSWETKKKICISKLINFPPKYIKANFLAGKKQQKTTLKNNH